MWKSWYQPDELSEVACPGCSSTSFKDIATEFGIAISRCRNCQLVYTRTPLPHSQSHYLVSKEEFLAKYGPVFRGEAPHPRDRNYDEQLRLLERHRGPGDLLDIGSHCGFFLRRARERGWRATGVEPSPVSACLAREQFGLDVQTGSLEEARFPNSSFDAISLVDVLEHVGKPRPLLAEVVRLLRSGGIIIVKVPNVRYVLGKYYLLGRIPGAFEDAFDAREHLVYYSPQTLSRMLRSAGFALEVMAVPSPIPSGGRLRRLLQVAGSGAARSLPGGVHLPLAPDLLVVARVDTR
jgi:SAM-dependent methyltransferase